MKGFQFKVFSVFNTTFSEFTLVYIHLTKKCTFKESFSRLVWLLLKNPFPKSELPNLGRALYASTAYPPVFTVCCLWREMAWKQIAKCSHTHTNSSLEMRSVQVTYLAWLWAVLSAVLLPFSVHIHLEEHLWAELSGNKKKSWRGEKWSYHR